MPSEDAPFGYKGRVVIMEQLVVTDEIQKFIRGDVQEYEHRTFFGDGDGLLEMRGQRTVARESVRKRKSSRLMLIRKWRLCSKETPEWKSLKARQRMATWF